MSPTVCHCHQSLFFAWWVPPPGYFCMCTNNKVLCSHLGKINSLHWKSSLGYPSDKRSLSLCTYLSRPPALLYRNCKYPISLWQFFQGLLQVSTIYIAGLGQEYESDHCVLHYLCYTKGEKSYKLGHTAHSSKQLCLLELNTWACFLSSSSLST